MERNRLRPARRHPAARSRVAVGAASLGFFGLLVTGMLNHETAVAAAPEPPTTTSTTPPVTRPAQRVVYLLLPDGRVVAVDAAAIPAVRPRQRVRSIRRVPITRSRGSR